MLICLCKAVSDSRVRSLIREGARTLSDVARATGAGTDCGACRETIAALLREELGGSSPASAEEREPDNPRPR
ncbi:MAG: (2Fe-2S)-binding protein [Candidatus Eisenbacteria bacterium]